MTDKPAIIDSLTIGRRVIAREAAALGLLATTLNGGFSEAVDLLLNARGRVIVCGMGKSGHIARKIAATFASSPCCCQTLVKRQNWPTLSPIPGAFRSR